MMNTRLIALSLAALLLSACGSTPSNHYMLNARTSDIPASNSPAIGVGPVVIPAYLDRDQLVYRESASQLKMNSTERWAEPLDAGIGRVVSLNLAGLLDTNNVQAFPYHAMRRPDFGVKLNILNLDAGADGARLVAEWLIYLPQTSEPVARRLSKVTVPLSAQGDIAAQLPQAYSDLLWQLSEEIAAEIQAQLD